MLGSCKTRAVRGSSIRRARPRCFGRRACCTCTASHGCCTHDQLFAPASRRRIKLHNTLVTFSYCSSIFAAHVANCSTATRTCLGDCQRHRGCPANHLAIVWGRHTVSNCTFLDDSCLNGHRLPRMVASVYVYVCLCVCMYK